jgi:hypothetical protein
MKVVRLALQDLSLIAVLPKTKRLENFTEARLKTNARVIQLAPTVFQAPIIKTI